MSCKNCGGAGVSPWGKKIGAANVSSNRKEEEMRPVKPWDLLNKKNWTMAEVREKRLEICHACPDLNKGICSHCHCVMSAKTALENAYCPLRKW